MISPVLMVFSNSLFAPSSNVARMQELWVLTGYMIESEAGPV
jgi:hypothetical protein